jgi:8-amino-7-oxononanoate synthase
MGSWRNWLSGLQTESRETALALEKRSESPYVDSYAEMRSSDFEHELKERLEALREQGLYRELRRIASPQSPHITVEGKTLLNFSSNDYLGLANEPSLIEAAIEAARRFGAGAGASRLICGSLAPYHELEENLAQFKNTEAALCFSTGYAAALGTIGALLAADHVIVLDKLVHACIIDAARLCGAKLRVFSHNDLNDLEAILKWAKQRHQPDSKSQTLVVTESVFSMDGDHAPLQDLVTLKEKYGAWLMVDEAHATGLYGINRRGLAEELGISDRIEVQMGTLGKALGASGGYICGSRALIEYLVNRSRSFIFSTAPVPAAAAAATAGIRFVRSEKGKERCSALWERAAELRTGLTATIHRATSNSPSPPAVEWAGEWRPSPGQSTEQERETRLQLSPGSGLPKAIFPLLVGDETKAVQMSGRLRQQGIFIPAIRYPTVARGSARLRLTLSAAHTRNDVQTLLGALSALKSK